MDTVLTDSQKGKGCILLWAIYSVLAWLFLLALLLQDSLKPAFTVTNLPGTTSTIQTAPTTSTSMQVSSGPSFPITNYLAPVSASVSPSTVTSANGTVLKTTGTSAVASGGLMQIPTGFTLMSGQFLFCQLKHFCDSCWFFCNYTEHASPSLTHERLEWKCPNCIVLNTIVS